MHAPKWLKRVRSKISEPIITDRSIDVLAMLSWLSFSGWGLASTVAGLPTIGNAAGAWYETAWGFTIAVLSLIAFTASFSTFFSTPLVKSRIKKKTVELVSVSMLVGFISVYPAFVIIAAIGGDTGRVALAFLTPYFLLFPTWRALHLYSRIRRLRDLQADVAAEKP